MYTQIVMVHLQNTSMKQYKINPDEVFIVYKRMHLNGILKYYEIWDILKRFEFFLEKNERVTTHAYNLKMQMYVPIQTNDQYACCDPCLSHFIYLHDDTL